MRHSVHIWPSRSFLWKSQNGMHVNVHKDSRTRTLHAFPSPFFHLASFGSLYIMYIALLTSFPCLLVVNGRKNLPQPTCVCVLLHMCVDWVRLCDALWEYNVCIYTLITASSCSVHYIQSPSLFSPFFFLFFKKLSLFSLSLSHASLSLVCFSLSLIFFHNIEAKKVYKRMMRLWKEKFSFFVCFFFGKFFFLSLFLANTFAEWKKKREKWWKTCSFVSTYIFHKAHSSFER